MTILLVIFSLPPRFKYISVIKFIILLYTIKETITGEEEKLPLQSIK